MNPVLVWMVVGILCTSCKRAPDHDREKWHRCWHTFAAWSAVDSVDPLPFESLFGVQSTRDILYHHCQFLKRCLPSGVLFVRSLHPRRPKWIMLFSHTVFNGACGELDPSNFFSKRISISSSVRAVLAFGLFPSPCRLSCFCFAFNASLVFLKSVSLKIVT